MKVEFRTSPLMSEELFSEYLRLKPPPTLFKRFRFPMFCAVFFAVIASPGQSHMEIVGQEYPKLSILFDAILFGGIGFSIGMIIKMINKGRVPKQIAKQIGTSPAVNFPQRTFSWDASGVAIASPVSHHEWK